MPTQTLAEALATTPPPVNAKEKCAFAERVEAVVQHEDDRKAMQAALDQPRWSSRALRDVLARFGVDISFSAIATHRRGACPCYKKAADA